MTEYLSNLNLDELRNVARKHVENLEFWLRRIVNYKFTLKYGSNYLYHEFKKDNYLFNSRTRSQVERRFKDEPDRYISLIDATVMDDLVKVICGQKSYQDNFRDIFENHFLINNSEVLRNILDHLISIRNKLAHSNDMSLREVEQAICYSNDLVECIKLFYDRENMNKAFNIPLITKYTDSFGNAFERNQFERGGVGRINFRQNPKFYLRPGDIIVIKVEVDPTYPTESYTLKWGSYVPEIIDQEEITYKVEDKDIGETFSISLYLTTKNKWHRLGSHDDRLYIHFKVLPE